MSAPESDSSLNLAGDGPLKVHLWNLELDLADRCAARRQYRSIRIVMYAPQSSPYAANGMCQGWYGKSREEAKRFIYDFYQEVAWLEYLGSK